MKNRILLGVNIDHVATLREARGCAYPDPVQAAILAEEAGADGITLHMREDRRLVNERDVRLIKQVLQTRMNLESAITEEMLDFTCEIAPEHVCFVPERREEITTEGGLDVSGNFQAVCNAVKRMKLIDAEVSLFIDPNLEQIKAAHESRAQAIEIHTGCYANAKKQANINHELDKIREATEYAAKLGLVVNAGHGLNYHNVKPIAEINEINELNIGHAIVSRAVMVGFKEAVQQMKQLMQEAREYVNVKTYSNSDNR
jgi:pyridoxine 5-phosphate synthase